MKRRNAKIKDFVTTPGSKVLSAKFGNQSKSVIVSGDDKNNINLWKITKDKPLVTLNYNAQSSAQTEVTAVQFNFNDTELYTGTNRGIINVWDIEAQKQSYTLKGHPVGISSLCVFPYEEQHNLLISGSYDTNIKLWDLRQRNQVLTMKGHTMLVNCLAGSPDGRIVVSGAQDSTVRLWDIGQGKCVNTFTHHEAAVTCLEFNPVEMALASASADKTIKYYDLYTYQLISSTKPDATPIQQVLFEKEGKILFSAANDSLKVWNMESESQLMDSVESQWRGILDLQVADVEEMLLGLAISQGTLGLWACPLQLINVNQSNDNNNNKFQPGNINQGGNNSYAQIHQRAQSEQPFEQVSNQHKEPAPPAILHAQLLLQQQQQQQQFQGYNNNIGNNQAQMQQAQKQQQYQQAQQFSNNNNNNNAVHLANQNVIIHNNIIPQLQHANSLHQISDSEEEEKKQQAIISQHFQALDNQSRIYNQILPSQQQIVIANNQGNHLPQDNEEIEEHIQVEQQQINNNNNNNQLKYQGSNAVEKAQNRNATASAALDLSSLTISDTMANSFNFQNVTDQQQQQYLKQIDFVNEVQREHSKFLLLMSNRLNYVKPIQHWWSQGNAKSSLYAISQLFDPCYVMDALQMTVNLNKLQYINVEGITVLLQKAKILIDSKYQSHIKYGFDFVRKIIETYKEEVVSIRNFSQLSKPDNAREERLRKYNALIDELRNIQKISRISKIAQRKATEEIGQLAVLLLNDLNQLFARIDNPMNH